MGSCTPDATLPNRMLLGRNTVLVPNASTTVTCGQTYSFSQVRGCGCAMGAGNCETCSFSQVPTSAPATPSPSPSPTRMPRPCMRVAQWIALGYDQGTTVGPQPPTATIIELARSVLSM